MLYTHTHEHTMSTLHEIKKAADWLVSVEDYRSVKREAVSYTHLTLPTKRIV